ncbi:hypothetical protein RY27_19520 [Litorilinea aerophila]|nr:hypothetical protein RY27_19520 [Litorilinea aerophila]
MKRPAHPPFNLIPSVSPIARLPGRAGWLLLAVAVLLLAGCTVRPIVAEEPAPQPPSERVPAIAVAPVSGPPGTTVFVSGAGWEPNEVVYVNLQDEQEGEPVEATVAIVTSDGEGRFNASFLYPLDERWAAPGEVNLLAYSLQTGKRATATFTVTEGTAAPATGTPTATSPTATSTVSAPAQAPGYRATPTPTTVQAGASDVARVVSYALNVRMGPSTAYPVVRAVSRGTPLRVLGQNASGSWLWVRLPDGTEGWVARAYTDYRADAPVVPTPTPPAVTATPTPTPTRPPVITGWRGEYYRNQNLAGAPFLIRDDAEINFDWGYGSPAAGIPADFFSVRWVRSLSLPAGTYRFYAEADDGIRVWVDGQLLSDEWHAASGRTYTADIQLSGDSHFIRVEFYEAQQLARARVWWEQQGDFPDWRGEYFDNRYLSGSPRFVRNDPTLDFNWGRSAPASGFPADQFSVRWTRSVSFDSGN